MRTAVAIGLFALAAWVTWSGLIAPRLGPAPVEADNLESADPLVAHQIRRALAAVEKRRGDLEIRSRLCQIYQANGLFQHAKDCYLQVVGGTRQRAREWFLLGRCYERLGDLEAAIDALEQAAAADTDYTAIHWQLALWYLDVGRLDDAERHLGIAQRLDPASEAGQIAAVRLRLQRRQYEQVVAFVTSSTLLAGRNGDYVRSLLASAYRGLGRPDRARDIWNANEPTRPTLTDPWQLAVDRMGTGLNRQIRIALAHLEGGRPSEAERVLLELAGTRPDDRRIHALLAKCYLAMGKPLEGYRILERSASSEPDNPTIRIQAALAALEASAVDRSMLQPAIDHAARAVSLAPEDPRSHLVMGASRLAAEDFTGARSALETAWSLDSRDPTALVSAARRFLAHQRTDDAQALLQNVLRTHRDHASVYVALALTRLELGDLSGARARLDQAEAAPVQDAEDLLAVRDRIASTS